MPCVASYLASNTWLIRTPEPLRSSAGSPSSPSSCRSSASSPRWLLWGAGVTWLDLGILAVMYVARRLRRDDRLPPHAHPPRLRREAVGARDVRDPRLDVGAGRRHPLGRRPPPPPRVHRRGGRPALPAHPRRRGLARRAQRPLALPHGLAVRGPAHVGQALRARPQEGPADPLGRQVLPAVGAARPRDPVRARLRALRRLAVRRLHRVRVGRPRARLPAAPRHLERELDLPHVRQQAVRDRGREPRQLDRRDGLARRGLAPQPPRLPDLRPPRPAPLPARPVLRGHPLAREARPGLERQAPEGRADRRQARSAPSRAGRSASASVAA